MVKVVLLGKAFHAKKKAKHWTAYLLGGVETAEQVSMKILLEMLNVFINYHNIRV